MECALLVQLLLLEKREHIAPGEVLEGVIVEGEHVELQHGRQGQWRLLVVEVRLLGLDHSLKLRELFVLDQIYLHQLPYNET